MPYIPIDSLDDARLDIYRDLPKANPTSLSGRFVVEGKLMVERLANSNYPIESIAVDVRHQQMVPGNISIEVPIFVIPANQIERLIGFNFHRGILACGRRKPPLTLSNLNLHQDRRNTCVVCVDIQDPTNLGGILRNCAAFGVDAVVLTQQCADPFSRRVLRVSMGTAFKLQLVQSMNLASELRTLVALMGFELVAGVLDPTAEVLNKSSRAHRTAILIGNEAHGLAPDIVEMCQRRVTIPMDLETDSLNAAAASAVLLYHFTRVATVA